MYKPFGSNKWIWILGVGVLGVACRQLDEATECFSKDDCGLGGACIDGICEGGRNTEDIDSTRDGTDASRDSASETQPETETDTETEGCVALPVNIAVSSPDEECCTGLEVIENCWTQDAESDGIACIKDVDCLSGTCDKTRGVCTCDGQEDCNDGAYRLGYCNVDKGYCGPSSCNDYFVCACFGGCEKIDRPSDFPEGERCCEGLYSVFPPDRPVDPSTDRN